MIEKRIIDYLNRISGHRYTYNPYLANIKRRLKETGYGLKEVCRMLRYKWEQWRNSDMEIYFRPSTLFRPSHFADYVEEAMFYWRKKARARLRDWREREEEKGRPLTAEEREILRKKWQQILDKMEKI